MWLKLVSIGNHCSTLTGAQALSFLPIDNGYSLGLRNFDCEGDEANISLCRVIYNQCLRLGVAGVQCGEPADTADTPNGICLDDQVLCQGEEKCIPSSFVCDGHPDCSDLSDESRSTCVREFS